jgi:hypothetical protein
MEAGKLGPDELISCGRIWRVTVTASQDWFPGRDYPDREIWLKIRATPKGGVSRARRMIHNSASGPMILGINAAKRAADSVASPRVGHPAKRGFRAGIVIERHAYYRRVYYRQAAA